MEPPLLGPGRPVVVMLSGGRDSVCLLDLAVEACGAGAVRALHVNYGLRGSASDGDEALCREVCAGLGVALTVVRAPSFPGGNLQAWAREVRYREARSLAAAWDEADIAVGHTATDQVETILYRLASSPSRRALLGMRERDGSLIRPLLSYTREETAEYCRERGLAWREDSSNASPALARGRVRQRLVPALREVHPAAEANVLALAELLRDEAAVLDELVDGVLGGRTEVELAQLRALPPALARLVLQRLADTAAGGGGAGAARGGRSRPPPRRAGGRPPREAAVRAHTAASANAYQLSVIAAGRQLSLGGPVDLQLGPDRSSTG